MTGCKPQSWDEYFLSICNAVGGNSKCMSRKIGAILVRDNVVICTGYNGPPRGIPHCNERAHFDPLTGNAVGTGSHITECPRRMLGYGSGEGLHMCLAAHAERNCLIQAARLGICTKDATVYMNCPVPCADCLIELINAGITEVVCTDDRVYDNRTHLLLSHISVRYYHV